MTSASVVRSAARLVGYTLEHARAVLTTLVELLGLFLIISGVSRWSSTAALILAGCVFVLVGYLEGSA